MRCMFVSNRMIIFNMEDFVYNVLEYIVIRMNIKEVF